MERLVSAVQRRGLGVLSQDEVRELALLYRQVASDLSGLRQDGGALTYERSLNQLLARAHGLVYSRRGGGWRAIWQFYAEDYPRLFRKVLPYTAVSLVLFLSGAVLGALLATARPEFIRHLLGPHMLHTIAQHRMWTESINSVAPAAASGIMTNNLSVTFSTYALGATAGVGTLYMVVWNGVLLGVVGAACAAAHMSLALWSFVAPHGSLELPSIVLSGAAGLRLAQGILFPGLYSRRFALSLAGAESVRLLVGVIPLLVIAGTLEGFFSPSSVAVSLKFAVGGILFCALLLWLFSGAGERGDAADQSRLLSLISR